MQSITAPADTVITCGLVVNELLMNTLKYAFPDECRGEVWIGLDVIDSDITLRIRDNGVGIPAEFDIHTADSLGLNLVTMLTERQLRGHLKLERSSGTEWIIQFTRKTASTQS